MYLYMAKVTYVNLVCVAYWWSCWQVDVLLAEVDMHKLSDLLVVEDKGQDGFVSLPVLDYSS